VTSCAELIRIEVHQISEPRSGVCVLSNDERHRPQNGFALTEAHQDETTEIRNFFRRFGADRPNMKNGREVNEFQRPLSNQPEPLS
jgi:hypothetical protein